jgi:hypothetical protein
VKDSNSNLFKTHEWAHANSANQQGINILTCQQVYWYHAAALGMFLVSNGGNIYNFTILTINNSKDITVAKVTCAGSVKASLAIGGYCNSHRFHVACSLSYVIV